jgi:hypothetical protein
VTDGSIRHISNFGDRPPKVSVGVNADEGIAPIYGDIFGSSFSDMKRILAAMNEQEPMMRMVRNRTVFRTASQAHSSTRPKLEEVSPASVS